jgi:hypothetical protein
MYSCSFSFNAPTLLNLYWLHYVTKRSFTFIVPRYDIIGRRAGIAQSVERLTTGRTVRGSNPGEGENLRTRPNGPWRPPSLLYNGYRVFPRGEGGIKLFGRTVDHPPQSVAEVKERVEMYLYSPSACSSVNFSFYI